MFIWKELYLPIRQMLRSLSFLVKKFSFSGLFQPQLSVILPAGLVSLGWTIVLYLLPLGSLLCRKIYKPLWIGPLECWCLPRVMQVKLQKTEGEM